MASVCQPLAWMQQLTPGSDEATDKHYRILTRLALAMGADGTGWVTQERLAEEAKAGLTTVKRAIRWAIDNGLLAIVSRGRRLARLGVGLATTYRLLRPVPAQSQQSESAESTVTLERLPVAPYKSPSTTRENNMSPSRAQQADTLFDPPSVKGPIPADFQKLILSDEPQTTWAVAECPDVQVKSATDNFFYYHLREGIKRADWVAAWRLWMLKAQSIASERAQKVRLITTAKSTREFAEFWRAYPRREAKQEAAKAFVSALTRASLETIIAGAVRYNEDPNRVQQFTKHPATWLNGDCWADDPLPVRDSGAVRSGRGDRLAQTLDVVARMEFLDRQEMAGRRALGQ